MKNLKLKTLLVILIASTFIMSNAVGIAADSQIGTTKQKKEIKPPDGEKWYEEGDEELYKFDIHPVTPKEGITGGILIYYGHFVKPPYKVEIERFLNEEYNRYGVTHRIIINGLPIYPESRQIREIKHKISERMMRRINKSRKPISKESDRKSLIAQHLMRKIKKEVKTYWKKLVSQYDVRKETHKKKIEKDIENYFIKHPEISKYKIRNFDSFRFYIPKAENDDFTPWQGVHFSPSEYLPPKEKDEFEKNINNRISQKMNRLKKSWENTFSRSIVSFYGGEIIYTKDNLRSIAKILLSSQKRTKTIHKIYQIGQPELDNVKFIYYNLKPSDILIILGVDNDK